MAAGEAQIHCQGSQWWRIHIFCLLFDISPSPSSHALSPWRRDVRDHDLLVVMTIGDDVGSGGGGSAGDTAVGSRVSIFRFFIFFSASGRHNWPHAVVLPICKNVDLYIHLGGKRLLYHRPHVKNLFCLFAKFIFSSAEAQHESNGKWLEWVIGNMIEMKTRLGLQLERRASKWFAL